VDLNFGQLGGPPAVARWLNIAQRYWRALGLLLSARSSRPLYVENRFLNVVSGAETFHRLAIGGASLPAERFEELKTLA
jgi:hypothetical protein